MSTLTIPYTDGTWGGGYENSIKSAYIRLTYEASNGTVKITEIEGQINWKNGASQDSWDYTPPDTYIKVGGTSKKITINQVYFKAGGWETWGLTDISWTGLTGKEKISFSLSLPTTATDSPSHNGAQFTSSIPMSLSTYKVTFNANGGSLGNVPSYQTKKYGINLALSSYEPTRSGYSFEGWGTSSSATTASYQPGSTYKSNSAITLYAIWKSENGKTTFYCDSSAYFLDHIHLKFYKKNSSNTQTVVWKSSNGATFTSHEKNTLNSLTNLQSDYSLSAARFQSFFDANQDEVDVTITVTTYNSSGTSLGSASRTFTMRMREVDGRPSAPSASVSRTATGATITLTRPSTYKYGATFKEWHYQYNYGKSVSLSGNTITAERYDTTNQTHVIQVWAEDSRGFISDKIDVVWYVRRKGPCVYQNGAWRAAKPRLYTSDGWTKRQAYVYNGSAWKRSKI